MSQNRRTYTKATYDKNIGRSTKGTQMIYGEYIYGNAVPKRDIQERPVRQPRRDAQQMPARQPQHEVRKNREKAHHMSAGYVLFLATALMTAAFILVNYIQLQAELTGLNRTVAAKESELNSLKVENDEAYNRIINSIDLEEIRRIAMQELGMIYAKEGQVIIYENEISDYMRRVAENE